MWTSFVDLIRVTIFAASHVCGGSLGGGVLIVSFVVRLALLPLTLRMARNALAQQRRLARLAPKLERLKKLFDQDPVRLFQETQALHRQHGIRLIEPRSLLGTALQLPLLGGLFAAVRSGLGARVRFLWIADLARTDGWLVMLVAGLSAAAAWMAPSPTTHQAVSSGMLIVVGVSTLVFLWLASSAVALSVGAGSLVSALQNWLLARQVRRNPAAV